MPKYGGFKYGQGKYAALPTSDPASPPPPTPTPAATPPTSSTTPTTTPTSTPPQTSTGTGSSGSDATLVGIPSIAYAAGIDVQPLLVDAADYGYNAVRWTAPGSAVGTLRLVRNATGYPTDENDGVVLYSGTPTLTQYDDRGLLPGREYYYAIYLQLATSRSLLPSTSTLADVAQLPGTGTPPTFFPAAIARVAAVADHGSSQQLVESLPRMYTSPDQDSVGASDNASQLARFLSIFGFQMDKMRTDLDRARPFQDAGSVPGSMLPGLMTTLGQPLEFGMGYRHSRILARDALYYYSRKGTALGVNALGKALTGLGVKARPGPNLLLNLDDASFENSVGRWSPASNCTIATDTSNANTPPTPTAPAKALPGGFTASKRAACRVTSTAAGTMSIGYAGGFSDTWGVSVVPRDYYAISAYVKTASTGRSITFAIEWRDIDGNLIATSTQTSGTTDTTSYQRLSFAGTAPQGAAYASPVVSWASVAAIGEVHYIDDVQFEDLSVPVPNGDFEQPLDTGYWTLHNPPQVPANLDAQGAFPTTTLGGWEASTGYTAPTLTRVTTGFLSPLNHVLEVDWPVVSAGQSAADYLATNLNIGQRYQFTCSVFVFASPTSPRVRIGETQGNGVNPTYVTRDTGSTTGSWVTLSFSVTATQSTMYFGVINDEAVSSGGKCFVGNVILQNLEYKYGTSMALDASTCVTGSKSLNLQGLVASQDTYATQTIDVTPGVTYTASVYQKNKSTGSSLNNYALYLTDRTPVDPVLSGSLTYATTIKVLAPKTGAYFGIDDNAASNFNFAITNETNAGRKFDIIPFTVDFSGSGDSAAWPTGNMQAMYDGGTVTYSGGAGSATITGGRIPYVHWSTEVPGGTPGSGMPGVFGDAVFNGTTTYYAYTYTQILAGDLDTYIDARAADVVAWGNPIMIAFDPSADSFNVISGSAYIPLCTIRAAAAESVIYNDNYAAAFRYIKQRFEDAGATNVTWVLSLSGEPGTNIAAVALNDVDYDWIAISGTVTTAGSVAGRWQSYVTRLDNGEAGAAGQTKPVMLDEWVVPFTPNSYFGNVISALQSGTLKRVKALIFNDILAGPSSFLATEDSTTRGAFNTLAANSYVNQTINLYEIANVSGTPNSRYYSQFVGDYSATWRQMLAGFTPISSQLEIRLYVGQGVANYDLVQVWRQSPAPYEDGHTVDVYAFADRYNYCTNPNFETSAANWNTGIGSDATTALSGYQFATTLARSTAQKHSGGASLLVTHPTASKSGTVTCITGLTPGAACTVSAYVYVPTGSPAVLIETDAPQFFATGTFIPTVESSITIASGATNYTVSIDDSVGLNGYAFPEVAGKWSRISATFVAKTTVHNVGFYALATTSGQTFYLDDVLVESSPTMGDYFDGGSSECDWEDGENLSRSNYIRQRNTRTKRLATKVSQAIPLGLPYAVRSAWPDA